MTDDDKLVIRRALQTEIKAFEERLAGHEALGSPASVALHEYLRKLRGALQRVG